MTIQVLNPGALTTVQDEGRIGYRRFGIPKSGVMDQTSFRLANRLLCNDPSCAVLEFTLFGGSYRFDDDTRITLTGADMQPTLNGSSVFMNRVYSVHAGDTLSLGFAVSGCRTYLGVSGGIDVPPVMGSRSTFIRCALGGFHGRALRAGDLIPCKTDRADDSAAAHTDCSTDQDSAEADQYRSIPAPLTFSHEITVRVIPGPQDDRFTVHGLDTFFSAAYLVSDQNDRMGCRMEGPAVESIHGCDIISDGTVPGCIQITSAGQPIVLMADAQTTGGYAKIGTIVSDDLSLLAQCQSHDIVHFKKITLQEVQI